MIGGPLSCPIDGCERRWEGPVLTDAEYGAGWLVRVMIRICESGAAVASHLVDDHGEVEMALATFPQLGRLLLEGPEDGLG